MSKKKKPAPPKRRSMPALALAVRGGRGAGKHHTREHDVAKGRRRHPKHRKGWTP